VEAFLDFVRFHWYFAIPMFAMSFCGVALVLWRLMLNINGNTNLNEFLQEFPEKLNAEGVEGALKFCQERTDIIPKRLYVAGLESAPQGLAAVKRSMASAIELDILPDLNFLLPVILAIAKIATMVGLLGTVLSMIFVFDKMQGSSPADQSRQIGLALFATALGLVTAIPLVFTHVLFKAWVQKFEVRMKRAAQKLIILLQAHKADEGKKPAPTPTPTPTPTPSANQTTEKTPTKR
jgi:biopolymer transport protein ExbB